MDTLDKIYDMMFCELDDIAKKEKLDSKDVELIDKFVDIIKDIDDISASNMGSSQMGSGGYMRGRSGRMMPMYSRGYGHMGRSYNGSREGMIDELERVMDMATDEKDRKAVERLISQMESRP